jgi:hypothetical protein
MCLKIPGSVRLRGLEIAWKGPRVVGVGGGGLLTRDHSLLKCLVSKNGFVYVLLDIFAYEPTDKPEIYGTDTKTHNKLCAMEIFEEKNYLE